MTALFKQVNTDNVPKTLTLTNLTNEKLYLSRCLPIVLKKECKRSVVNHFYVKLAPRDVFKTLNLHDLCIGPISESFSHWQGFQP